MRPDREAIIAMAKDCTIDSDCYGNPEDVMWSDLERFYSLAYAAGQRDEREAKDNAYYERNQLVALLATMFPSGIKRTAIEGWSDDWHGCVYIDFPWGQASWHYHDSQAHLFANLPAYEGEWDGHTTEEKYAAIRARKDGE